MDIPKRKLSDLEKEAPQFAQAEHEAAREEGYIDATERWAVSEEIRREDEYHRSVTKRAKAQFRADMESVGVPFEKLAALSEAANNLPGSPDYVPPDIQVPKNETSQRAAQHGIKRRMARWVERCEEAGMSPGGSSDGFDGDWEEYRHLQVEGEEIKARLEAMGGDFWEALEEIDAGNIDFYDDFDESE